MSEILKTMALNLATIIYDTMPVTYEKYSRIAELRSEKMGITVRLAQAAILERNGFDFQKLLNEAGFKYSIRIPDIQRVCEQLLESELKGIEITLVDDDLDDEVKVKVGDVTYNLNSDKIYLQFQDDLIELISLSAFYGGIESVEGKTTNLKPDQKIFNIDEAAEFTGYKKSYLYKVKSEGLIKAGQPKKGGALRFKREDLINFMFRKESIAVDDFI